MPVPAVNVVLVNPVPFPISIWPLVGVVVNPVPPFETGKVPVTPEVRGKPVAFVNTAALGVPKAGVVKVGEVDSTRFPDPVDDVTPVPPFAIGKVPVTLEVRFT